MNPRSFLSLAKALVDDATNSRIASPLHAAACRSAISRAYYATFQVACEFFTSIKLEVGRNAASHITIQHALNNSGDASLIAVGMKLGTLHRDRLKADYEPNWAESDKSRHAAKLILLADEAIAKLDELTSGVASRAFDGTPIASQILNWASLTQKNIRSTK